MASYYINETTKETRSSKRVEEVNLKKPTSYETPVTNKTLLSHKEKVSKKAHDKITREANIIRLMWENDCYPDIVNKGTDKWVDNQISTKCLNMMSRTLQGTNIVGILLAYGINLRYTRLLKRKVTQKNCNITPYHFPIPQSITNVDNMIAMVLDDIKYLHDNIQTKADELFNVMIKNKTINKGKKEIEAEISQQAKEYLKKQNDTGISYTIEFAKTATYLLYTTEKGTYPSYPHSVYSGNSYQLLYAIALVNYLMRYHVRKQTNTTTKDDLIKEMFKGSVPNNIATFGNIKHVNYIQQKEGKDEKKGQYVWMIPDNTINASGKIVSKRQKQDSTNTGMVGKRIPRKTNTSQHSFNVRKQGHEYDDAIIKQKRIRDHLKGARHMIITPTRGSKIMLWTNINTFMFQHGTHARHGLAMMFKYKLLPREMLKQITIASIETGALYRLSPNAKQGMELIPYKKYPTTANMPNQVFNKYAMFIDENAYLCDHTRKSLLEMFTNDMKQKVSDPIDSVKVYDYGYTTKDNKSMMNFANGISAGYVSLTEISTFKNYVKPSFITDYIYNEKVERLITNITRFFRPTRDSLIGTSQKQRIYVHEELSRMTKNHQTVSVGTYDTDSYQTWLSSNCLPNGWGKFQNYVVGIYAYSSKIPEISHEKLLEALPLTTHPRDVWYLNMESLLTGIIKVPTNHIRVGLQYYLYKDIKKQSQDNKLVFTDEEVTKTVQTQYDYYLKTLPSTFIHKDIVIYNFALKGIPYPHSKMFLEGVTINKETGKLETYQPSANRTIISPRYNTEVLQQAGYQNVIPYNQHISMARDFPTDIITIDNQPPVNQPHNITFPYIEDPYTVDRLHQRSDTVPPMVHGLHQRSDTVRPMVHPVDITLPPIQPLQPLQPTNNMTINSETNPLFPAQAQQQPTVPLTSDTTSDSEANLFINQSNRSSGIAKPSSESRPGTILKSGSSSTTSGKTYTYDHIADPYSDVFYKMKDGRRFVYRKYSDGTIGWSELFGGDGKSTWNNSYHVNDLSDKAELNSILSSWISQLAIDELSGTQLNNESTPSNTTDINKMGYAIYPIKKSIIPNQESFN